MFISAKERRGKKYDVMEIYETVEASRGCEVWRVGNDAIPDDTTRPYVRSAARVDQRI